MNPIRGAVGAKLIHELALVELKPKDIPGAVVTDKEIGKLESIL